MQPPVFHLAIPVHDLPAVRGFYGGVLGCPEGRSSARWVDFDFFGHQLVAHLIESGARTGREGRAAGDAGTNVVDGDDVPAPHFGVVLEWPEWEALAERLRAADVPFVIAPRVRFAGRVGEQGTFFVRDPSGNALEFKALRDPGQLFARGE
jgi:extradiol dioxygenase family protein